MTTEQEQKFQKYVDQVESGKYKSHKEMIRKYQKLLDEVTPDSELAEKIEEEIDAHQCDDISDQMDKNRHGE